MSVAGIDILYEKCLLFLLHENKYGLISTIQSETFFMRHQR
jgi:hypothetical protein